MTCIVGFIEENNNKVWMGADSAGVGDYDYSIRKDKKIFIRNNMLIGFTSSFRMGQLLHWQLQIPKHVEGLTIEEYMNTAFIEAVRKCFKDYGYSTINNNRETAGTFLVGYKGHLFKIYNDFQVEENIDLINACGCGEMLAVGAGFAYLALNKKKDPNPKKIIKLMLQTSVKANIAVKPPFHILSI